MGFFDKLFKSDDKVLTKNTAIMNALKILQNSSLSYDERVGALGNLKSVFLTSSEKNDLKIISNAILETVTYDESMKIRETALKTFDSIVEHCFSIYNNNSSLREAAQFRLNAVSGEAVSKLILMTKYKIEKAKELRHTAYWTLSKMAFFSLDDERISFFASSLSDTNEDIRMAVICTFENLVGLSDDTLKRRIARFSLSALCEALDDSAIWVRAANALGGLGKFGLGAAPFLFQRLDDAEGESAAAALRNVTGEKYGKDEKLKWEQWLKANTTG